MSQTIRAIPEEQFEIEPDSEELIPSSQARSSMSDLELELDKSELVIQHLALVLQYNVELAVRIRALESEHQKLRESGGDDARALLGRAVPIL